MPVKCDTSSCANFILEEDNCVTCNKCRYDTNHNATLSVETLEFIPKKCIIVTCNNIIEPNKRWTRCQKCRDYITQCNANKRLKIKALPQSGNTCRTCFAPKPENAFNNCDDCIKADTNNHKKQTTAVASNINCKTCSVMLSNTSFLNCAKCRETNNQKNVIHRNARKLYMESLPDKDNTCELCLAVKPDDSFLCKNSGESFRSKRCDECRAMLGKHRQTWEATNPENFAIKTLKRQKRRAQNEELREKRKTYIKKRRETNPDIYKEYNNTRRNKINHTFNDYKAGAIKRDLEFTLSLEEVVELVKRKCTYCDQIDSKRSHVGIDRVNNLQGYISSNVVACCRICNRIKHCQDLSTFFGCGEHILAFNGLIVGNLYPEYFADIPNKPNYTSYKNGAGRRNLHFELTLDEFNTLCTSQCYICGKPASDTHYNGIDRTCNDIGYVSSNTKACCNTCNFKKREHTLDTFLSHLCRIRDNKDSALAIINGLDGTQQGTYLRMVGQDGARTKKIPDPDPKRTREAKVRELYSDTNIKLRAAAIANKKLCKY